MEEKQYNIKKASIKGFALRSSQNILTQVMSFVIQIVLARILLPEDFGVIAITSTFIAILNVIVTTGFTSALVQQKKIDEVDKSSMFYLSMLIGMLLYALVFFSSPLFAEFYKQPLLTSVLRVQGISLLLASLLSVDNAMIMRNLEFKKSFVAGLLGVICHGAVGIIMALKGFGVWALVIGTLSGTALNCVVILILCRWMPSLVFSLSSVRRMLAFSSKVLAGDLLDSIFNSCKTFLVGKVYDETMLGYYNKGYQFPATMMGGIDGAMRTVLFSSLSKIQDDKPKFVAYLRRSMKLSLTVVVPLLCGMAAVADPMIRLLLTDKWENSIPFVMLTCAICLFWPLTSRAQALNSVGKSGTNLIINMVLKVLGVGLLFASIPFGVYVMCASHLISSLISTIIYSFIISKYFGYSVRRQLADVLPVYGVGFLMFGCVYGLSLILNIKLIFKLIILVIVGAAVYIGVSWVFKMDGFMYILDMIRNFFQKRREGKKAEI